MSDTPGRTDDERTDTMVARDRAHEASRRPRATARLFNTWRSWLGRGWAAAAHGAGGACRFTRRLLTTLPTAFTSGVREPGDARAIAVFGVAAFAVGTALSIGLASQDGRPAEEISGALVWILWLLVRLAVLRIVGEPSGPAENAGVLAAWGMGLVAFVVPLRQLTGVSVEWPLSVLLTWLVLRASAVPDERARRAVLVALGIEAATALAVLLVRNAHVIGVLLRG